MWKLKRFPAFVRRFEVIEKCIYTCDELNRMLSSEIAKEVTNSGCDTLGNLALATGRNKRVDYK